MLRQMVTEAQKALVQAEETIKQLTFVAGMMTGKQYATQETITRIAAKKELHMPLTQKERAMWVLYGPQGR